MDKYNDYKVKMFPSLVNYPYQEGVYHIVNEITSDVFKEVPVIYRSDNNIPHCFIIENGYGGSIMIFRDLWQLIDALIRYMDDLFVDLNCDGRECCPISSLTIRAIWFADDRPEIKLGTARGFCVYEDEDWPYYFDTPREEVWSIVINEQKYWVARVESIAQIIDTTKE